MSTPVSDSTRVRVANVGSWSGLGLGLVLLVVVTVIQMTATHIDPDSEVLAGLLDNITAGVLVALILGSLTVQVGVRIARNQRRLAAGQRALMDRLDRIEPTVIWPSDVDTEAIPATKGSRRRRRSTRKVEAPQITPAEVVEPDNVQGLTPEMVEIARETTRRLRGES